MEFYSYWYRTSTRELSKPELIESLNNEQVIDISCGGSHSLALTIDGQVYAWGENKYGQLGIGNHDYYEDNLKPVKFIGFDGEKVKMICCGVEH